MKKVVIYTLALLFLFSVYNDLNGGSLQNYSDSEQEIVLTTDYKAVYLKVQHGDTILSIVERLNEESMDVTDIDQILVDFKLLNPNIDPYEVKVDNYYYFPLYE